MSVDVKTAALALEKIRSSQSGIVLWNGEDAEEVQREHPFRHVIKINFVQAGESGVEPYDPVED